MYYSLCFSSLPRCTHFIRFRQQDGWDNRGRINKQNGVVFALNGSATFWVDGKEHQLSVGDWLFMHVGSRYRAHTDDFFEFYSISFDPPFQIVEEIPHASYLQNVDAYGVQKPAVIYLTDRIEAFDMMPEMIKRCSEMQRLFLQPGTEEKLMVDLYWAQLLVMLAAKVREKRPEMMPSLLKQAIDYIHERFTQPLTLSELCAQLQVSKSYLARLFKKYTGMTVTTYINSVKLDYATQILLERSMNIAQIAEYLGFRDSSYFSRLFHKRFGVTPLKFARFTSVVRKENVAPSEEKPQ